MSTKQEWKIGDCLKIMRELPADSIDIIMADPPYYKIKDDEWDNQWKSFQDYLDWLEVRAIEMKRVLKNNGSLYMFGDDHRIAYIQVMMDKHFTFLNHLVWYKRNNQAIKAAATARRFVSVSERILFYSNDFNIRKYMRHEYEQTGMSYKEINNILGVPVNGGGMAVNYFSKTIDKTTFPTPKMYSKLQSTGFFKKKYECVFRPFNYTKGMYEVFDIPIISAKENTDHSTTKPLEVITRLIKTSMKDGAVVLDPFCGSGTTLEVCMNVDLDCLAIDRSDEWVPHYKKRLRSDNSKLTDTW